MFQVVIFLLVLLLVFWTFYLLTCVVVLLFSLWIFHVLLFWLNISCLSFQCILGPSSEICIPHFDFFYSSKFSYYLLLVHSLFFIPTLTLILCRPTIMNIEWMVPECMLNADFCIYFFFGSTFFFSSDTPFQTFMKFVYFNFVRLFFNNFIYLFIFCIGLCVETPINF